MSYIYVRDPPVPPSSCGYIHMRLYTTYDYGHHFISCNMHAYILYVIHEHVLFTQYSEQPTK